MATTDPVNEVLTALFALSGWEAIATLLGIAYVVLAIRQLIWAWPSAFISTLIYTVLFWQAQLPLQSLLNAYYLAMAVYGFWLWHQPPQATTHIQVHTQSPGFHLGFLALGSLLTVAIGLYLATNDYSAHPYLDAGVMIFSVLNTYLMARKLLENWLYWLVINSAAIYLYWLSGFYLTIVMFMLYFVLAIIGYLTWRKTLDTEADHQAS